MESFLSPPRPAGLLQLPRGFATSSAWGLGLMGWRCHGEMAPGTPQSSRGVPASWSRVPLWGQPPPRGLASEGLHPGTRLSLQAC